MKEITVKLNKREVEIVKEALDNQKFITRIKTSSDNVKRREEAINELYNIEKVEEKLEGKA